MTDAINDQISRNVKILRKEMGLTLDDLSVRSDVSKSMLSEIERGGTNPTVLVLWKIAEGLKVPLTRLISSPQTGITVVRAADQILLSEKSGYRINTIFPYSDTTHAELLNIVLPPGGRLQNSGHRNGVEEMLIVTHGKITLILNDAPEQLETGDAAHFDGNLPHELINTGNEPAAALNILFYK